jgi:hypothetical protein
MIELKLTNSEYLFCCELIWGGIPFEFTKGGRPISKQDNMESPIFRDKAPEILKKYPQLNKSFFEQHG